MKTFPLYLTGFTQKVTVSGLSAGSIISATLLLNPEFTSLARGAVGCPDFKFLCRLMLICSIDIAIRRRFHLHPESCRSARRGLARLR